MQCNSLVRADFPKAGDRPKTHPCFSMSLDSVIFLSLGPYTASITTVSQQLVMFIRHKINEQPRLQKNVAKIAFLNSHFGRGTNRMILHTERPKIIRQNPMNMPCWTSTSTYECTLSITTNLSQSTGFRTVKFPDLWNYWWWVWMVQQPFLDFRPMNQVVHTSTKIILHVSNCSNLQTHPKQHPHIGSRTPQALLHIEVEAEVDELSGSL